MPSSRLLLVAASLAYALALHSGHVLYLYPVWGYYGFTYAPPSAPTVLLIAALVTIGAATLPRRLSRPSALVMVGLFGVVYVPTMTFTLCLHEGKVMHYLPSLLALAAGFTFANLTVRAGKTGIPITADLPREVVTQFFLVLWLVSAAILFYSFGSIMQFAGLDQVYEQRALAFSANSLVGYVQTYFANVFSPALLALGLVHRRKWLVLLGISGCVIIYAITASRTVLLLPAVILALNFALTSRFRFMQSSTFTILFLAGCVTASTIMGVASGTPKLIPVYIQFRTLGLPGLTFSQYYDFFLQNGFTYWSHVKGLNLFVAPPPELAPNKVWPGLGYLIGDLVYGDPKNNHNANLFVSDGLAAAGHVGVIVISIVLATWLAILDRVANHWDRRFTLLISVPLTLALTNGQLSTILISFGGIFWIVIFRFFRAHRRKSSRHRPIGFEEAAPGG